MDVPIYIQGTDFMLVRFEGCGLDTLMPSSSNTITHGDCKGSVHHVQRTPLQGQASVCIIQLSKTVTPWCIIHLLLSLWSIVPCSVISTNSQFINDGNSILMCVFVGTCRCYSYLRTASFSVIFLFPHNLQESSSSPMCPTQTLLTTYGSCRAINRFGFLDDIAHILNLNWY